jgi:tetratricopeptide (TPR) repeat protein
MIKEGYRAAEKKNQAFSVDVFFPYLSNIKILFLLLFTISLIVYFNSFSVPFYLDDFPSIVENTAIHDITEPGKIWGFYFPRFIGYLSFSLNYAVGGTSTLGYHMVNFFIHFLAGISIFYLTRFLLIATVLKATIHKDRAQSDSYIKKNSLYLYTIPFIAALIFLINPQQTQAVTYIVQRLSSMAALFYLAALVSYCYARINSKYVFFLFTLFFAGLAFFSKQNTATLPLAIALIEFTFFQPPGKIQWEKAMLIALPVMAVFGFAALYFFDLSMDKLDAIFRSYHTESLTRVQYFATQTLVVWHYIRQFFIPLDLHLDYDFPVQQSLFSIKVLLALGAHIGVLLFAFIIRKKHAIIFFAISFYYLTLMVESSIIPITDIVFEHRTYLPNAGLSMLVAMCFYLLFQQQSLQKPALVLLALLLAWFSYLTFARNTVWADQIRFYQNETKLSPNKERVWADLGKYYLKEKQYNEALKSFGTALNLGKEGNTINALPTTLLNTYFALLYTNQLDKAAYFETLIPLDLLSRHDKAVFYFMQGNRLAKISEHEEAQKSYRQALKINPSYLNAKANLAATYIAQKQANIAKQLLLEVLSANPKHKTALIYLQQLNQ